MFCISISSGYGDSTWHNGSIVERKEIVRGGGWFFFFCPMAMAMAMAMAELIIA